MRNLYFYFSHIPVQLFSGFECLSKGLRATDINHKNVFIEKKILGGNPSIKLLKT